MTFDTPGMKGDVYPVNSNVEVDAVGLHSNGNIIVVGGFDNFNSSPVEGILELNGDGSRDLSFVSNGAGAHGRVYSLLRDADGKLLVGYAPISGLSRDTQLNGTTRGGIGRLNADGTTDTTFTSLFDPESVVFNIALQSDGKILINGTLRLVGSLDVIEFARLNSDGTLDTSFVVPNGFDVHVGAGAFAIQPDGKILATYRHGREGSMVRLNSDGTLDNSFSAIFGFDAGVDHIVVQPDGRIVVTGIFTGANGSAARIGRLNANGSLDSSFDPGTGPDNLVRAVVLQPDGRIVIAGWFVNFNGTPRPSIARLNSGGSLDTTFVPINIDTDQFQNPRHVRSLALQINGKIVIGNEQGGETAPPSNRVFRLNADGSLDSSFVLGTGIEGTDINAIALQPDEDIIIGGDFSIINGVARLGLARMIGVTRTAPSPTPTPTPTPTPSPSPLPTPTPTPTPSPGSKTIQFSETFYIEDEGGADAIITVTRAGDASAAASVVFQTIDNTSGLPCDDVVNNLGAASARCDYSSTITTLSFAPGQTQLTIGVPLIDDVYIEGPEHLRLQLSTPQGASLGATTSAIVTIFDNDFAPLLNPVDEDVFFVRQNYLDFLNREPDAAGLAFWTNEITSCGTDVHCREVKRINVTAAFYLSIEFQQTGYLVYRLSQAAYNTGERLPLDSFRADNRKIGQGVVVNQTGWEQVLEQNKRAFVDEFVARPTFVAAYPLTMTAAQFVDALSANTSGSISQAERDAFVADLSSGAKTRAQVLRGIAEDGDFFQKEFTRAFVLMQYFGYLRRAPNELPDATFAGYDFWLTKLNQFNGNFVDAEMVKSFIVSGEYRHRFGQ